MTLLEFLRDSLKDYEVPDGQMLTHAVVMYRAVKTTEFDEDGDMPERAGYVATIGCGAAMQRGLVTMIEELWAFRAAEDEFGGEDDDDDSA